MYTGRRVIVHDQCASDMNSPLACCKLRRSVGSYLTALVYESARGQFSYPLIKCRQHFARFCTPSILIVEAVVLQQDCEVAHSLLRTRHRSNSLRQIVVHCADSQLGGFAFVVAADGLEAQEAAWIQRGSDKACLYRSTGQRV